MMIRSMVKWAMAFVAILLLPSAIVAPACSGRPTDEISDRGDTAFMDTESDLPPESFDVVYDFRGRARHGEDISVFVDFAIHSSQRRFFVYDNRNDSLIASSKCGHGCGGGSTSDNPVFSNEVGSMCSSLGEYRLRKVGRTNNYNLLCIRLDGLSPTNSNAARRGIVIHNGMVWSSDEAVGSPIPMNKYLCQGCFTISKPTLDLLCDSLNRKLKIYLYATCDE